jgi:CRISPR-associated protein Cas2
MRNVFLVSYDIADDKRRTKVFKKLKGRGDAVQFSVFRCRMSPTEKRILRAELWDLLNLDEDRLLLLDLGPEDGRGDDAWEIWGKELIDLANFDGPQIV